MEFLRAILGDELYQQVSEKINAHNGNEANKDNLIKIANLGGGEYVSKLKYDDIVQQLTGKTTELDKANGLIADLKKSNAGNEALQGKITAYEGQVEELQEQLHESDVNYAMNLLLMDAGCKDAEMREFLIYKHRNQLKEDGKTLELDENKHIKGGEEIVSGFKTSNPAAFEATQTNRKVLEDNRLKKGDNDPVTVTREQFAKMGYNERLKLKTENEALFKQLTTN